MSPKAEARTVDEGTYVLSRVVRDRRLEMGLSVNAAAKHAGINRLTWTAIEDGSRRTQEHNYAGVERALQWAAGSIQQLLSGEGQPALVDGWETWPHEAFSEFLERTAARAGYEDVGIAAANGGVDPVLVAQWKRGLARPTLDELRLLAPVLGLRPVDLWIASGLVKPEEVDADDSVRRLPEDLRELVELYYDETIVTDDDRETILASVRLTVRGTLALINERTPPERRRSRPVRRKAG
ncbi:MAG: hypothetical protein ABW000_07125 [Actinoplanes sp.]